MSLDQAERATPEQRRLVAQIAGVRRPPSDATWLEVVALLRARARGQQQGALS